MTRSSRHRISKIGASAGVSLLALIAATPAHAQDAPVTVPATPSILSAPQGDAAEGEGGDIVVTARRAAIESAIRRKEASDTIIDSVVADDAGKLPDNSITEVLQRVSGVAIVRFDALGDPDHFSAQGSGIQVRGLSGVAGRLNGREIFSANGGRGLSFGDVTPELMAAVDVYKSSTADLIEGGTGGQIDLRTKMPFDYNKPAVQGGLNVTYGDLREKASYGGSLLVTDTYATSLGRIGYLIDIARNEFTQASQFVRTEPYYKVRQGAADYFVPGGFTYGDQDYDRTRTGVYAAVQWEPADNLTISQTFFQSKYDDENVGHGIFATSKLVRADPAASQFDSDNGLVSTTNLFTYDPVTFGPATAPISAGGDTGFSASTSKTTDYSTKIEWQADDRVKLTAAYQHVKSTYTRRAYDLFPLVPYPNAFSLDVSGSLPQIVLPDASLPGFSDPARYMWNASQDHYDDNVGTLDAFTADAEFDLGDGFLRTFRAGARYANRSEQDQNSGYNWQAFGQGWNGSPQTFFSTAPAEDIQNYTFDNFFRGKANLPTNVFLPSDLAARRIDVAGDHAKYGNPILADAFLPIDLTDSSTETLAAYALLRFDSRQGAFGIPFQGNVGIRFLSNKNRSDGFFQQNASTSLRNGVPFVLPSIGTPRGGGRTYERFLPSVNLQLLPDPSVHLRFGYNITLDNPGFNALRASGSLSVRTATNPAGGGASPFFDGFTTDSGNPTLKPLISNNFDLSAEWYPKNGTEFHVAAFHKTLENVLIYGSGNIPIAVTTADGSTVTENVQFTNTFNATEHAKINGVEIGARTFFDMLPGFLSGFGVEANYTFIDSKNPGDSYIDINGVQRTDVPFAGLSKHNYNLTALYEKSWLSARISYSWRSRYLMSTNSNGTNGDYIYYSGATPSTANCTVGTATCQFTDISLPIYSEPYGTLDAGVTFRVLKNVSFSVQGSNLLNTVAKTSMGGYNNDRLYIRSWFVSDRRFDAKLTFAF